MTAEIFLDELEVIAASSKGISSIRQKIIDLAIRGKLVQQDPTDEHASVLLERMTAEKERLVKEKKLRKQKPISSSEIEQKPFDIPANWTWSYLGNIGNIFTGNSMSKVAKSGKYSKVPDGRPYIMTPNIGYGCDIESYDTGIRVPFDDEDYRVARPNTPLVCKEGGSAGRKVGYSDREICFGNKLIALETYAEYSPRFVFYFFQSQVFFSQFSENMSGIIGGISLGAFNSIAIPSPPIAEQYRIVKKVEALMEQVDRLEEAKDVMNKTRVSLRNSALSELAASKDSEEIKTAWERISDQMNDLFIDTSDVSSLRQIILQLAVCGRLVPQDSNEEPAGTLLQRISEEKARLVKEKKIRKPKPLPPIETDEVPFEIPEGWEWVRLSDLCSLITKGSSPKWQGISYVDPPDGILFVTSENVGSRHLIMSKRKHVEEGFNEISPRSILMRDDILLNIVGASIGRAAIFNIDEVANINQAVCLLRTLLQAFSGSNLYLLNFLNSELGRSQMFSNQVDNARANLSMGNIANFLVPLPPASEQHRIVAMITRLMVLCDDFEDALRP